MQLQIKEIINIMKSVPTLVGAMTFAIGYWTIEHNWVFLLGTFQGVFWVSIIALYYNHHE